MVDEIAGRFELKIRVRSASMKDLTELLVKVTNKTIL